ncbi:mucin-5AC-like [Gigantopelta aegis]|uniref:mucin-5AC-like n=1 Tax=Gigantopelta aegis TaxID=1735272 RepID=UPI001B88C9F3|nr:mucin-5AC-like [Gigantopelta aegis]
MQMDLFVSWFKHFVKSSGASKDNPVLLILDGHATHTKNLEVIDLARENGVVLLCLPPHCSHRMQPLDVSFMKPLSTYYDQELEKWLRNNTGRVVTTFQIAELFGKEYMKSATALTAANGFRRTGIYPTDRDAFLPHEFAAADATDSLPRTPCNVLQWRQKSSYVQRATYYTHTLLSASQSRPDAPTEPTSLVAALPSALTTVQDEPMAVVPTSALTPTTSIDIVPELTQPVVSTSSCALPMEIVPQATPSTSTSAIPQLNAVKAMYRPTALSNDSISYISPFEISPPPKATRTNRKPNVRRGTTVILTSSPYIATLIESKKLTSTKTTSNTLTSKKTNLMKNTTKRSVKTTPKTTFGLPKKCKTSTPVYNHSSDDEANDAECIYCNEWWSRSKQDGMIQCGKCMKWSHPACAGIDENDDDVSFTCDFCL